MADNPKEANKINPKLPITPKESNLDLKYNQKLERFLSRIPQIELIESWISAKTEVATINKVTIPISAGNQLLLEMAIF